MSVVMAGVRWRWGSKVMLDALCPGRKAHCNMKHRIYLDSHFVDYLWDHRGYIWEEDTTSLERALDMDESSQGDEYLALAGFPEMCWFNGWRITIGNHVLRELEQIPDRVRRESLLRYAGQLRTLDCSGLDGEGEEESQSRVQSGGEPVHPLQLSFPGFEREQYRGPKLTHFPLSIREALSRLPAHDLPLVEEAAELGCDVFLTTDDQLLTRGRPLEYWLNLRIRKLTEFIAEEGSRGRIKGSREAHLLPDLLLYAGMIPGNTF
jgi:hypothetical protein